MDQEVESVLDRIRTIRITKQLSVLDVATKAGISHSYLYYIESKKKIPTITTLHKLATAMDIKMIDFFK
ncbi:helix-turn-helix domain-containing protein [Breznakiella homolactica]|uniref:Helix-turn-helix transcriptional regulator n=1 Tax=Breznakiella homolactica TaxID=2798577 RepID=A0A7T8BAJ6_9SPIR|nr:helix-turn-helix transcriptional regulator [Breznakiella homolactica]QQO09080.1 helix-turn-helix domain-containing protein [Breznakiella homolactica]